MRPIYLLPVLAVLLAGCTPLPARATPTPVPTATPDPRVEENAVFAALFQGMVDPQVRQLVVEDHTTPFGTSDWEQLSQYIQQNMPDLAQETLDDYRARNAEPMPLTDYLSLPIPFALISEQERNEIFQTSGSGWDEFYRRYPNSSGLTSISRVGFNPGHTQAFVYIGTQSHYLAGAGFYVLLVRENGTWKVTSQVMAWIS